MADPTPTPIPTPENDDDVRVSVDEQGKVTGATYHTDPNGPHGSLNPWVVPVDDERTEGGFFANTEERPSYTYTRRDLAEMFGLRECNICLRHRLIADNLENLVIYKGRTKSGKVRLTINEDSVSLEVGQTYDLKTGAVATVPGSLAPLLGIDGFDEEDE